MGRRMTWAEKAARKNAKRKRKDPLLAWGGLIEEITPGELRERTEAIRAAAARRHALADARAQATATELREELLDVLGAVHVHELDAWRDKTYPLTPEYSADFWWRMREDHRAGGPCTPWVIQMLDGRSVDLKELR